MMKNQKLRSGKPFWLPGSRNSARHCRDYPTSNHGGSSPCGHCPHLLYSTLLKSGHFVIYTGQSAVVVSFVVSNEESLRHLNWPISSHYVAIAIPIEHCPLSSHFKQSTVHCLRITRPLHPLKLYRDLLSCSQLHMSTFC
jgi:hypothetical protein